MVFFMSSKKSSRERSYTKDQIIEHQLTKWISSILGQSDKELTTTMIYNDIKTIYKEKLKNYYPDKTQDTGSIKKGLNRNTVLDHLNAMKDHEFVNKKIAKNNIAFWSKTKDLPLEPFTVTDDKHSIDELSDGIKIFEEYGVHLYGYRSLLVSKDIDKINQQRLIEGIKKIKEGMNEIEYARDERSTYHRQFIYNFIIRNNFTPVLDRRIFAFLIFFAIYSSKPFPYIDKSEKGLEKNINNLLEGKQIEVYIPPGFDFIDGALIVSDPHPFLIETLKSNFEEYKNKTDEEIKKMLKSYKLSPILYNLFSHVTFDLPLQVNIFPFLVVAHSESLFRIFSRACAFNEIQKTSKSLKINSNQLKEKFFYDLKNEPSKEVEEVSYHSTVCKIQKESEKKYNGKCPNCGKPRSEKLFSLDVFLQDNKKWLT